MKALLSLIKVCFQIEEESTVVIDESELIVVVEGPEPASTTSPITLSPTTTTRSTTSTTITSTTTTSTTTSTMTTTTVTTTTTSEPQITEPEVTKDDLDNLQNQIEALMATEEALEIQVHLLEDEISILE